MNYVWERKSFICPICQDSHFGDESIYELNGDFICEHCFEDYLETSFDCEKEEEIAEFRDSVYSTSVSNYLQNLEDLCAEENY